MCADIDEIAQNSSLRLTARARQLKLIDVIAGLFEAKHANPITETREFRANSAWRPAASTGGGCPPPQIRAVWSLALQRPPQ